ncbi:uncharacterized protein LOC128392528 isoform X2 [Panonychus citri]|uniref:uncharacterized protein LOC128392528 isoform X2 n=1 Tax=Panonychus citri TaxID=50023 RepID=UPI0023073569|nr:uncharacterized protein LOC128392528 isoform X2 [Panonychus citri]
MEVSEESVTVNEPASNPNNCGKRFYHFSGCTEYRAAFNWPPGSQQSTTISQQIVNSGPSSSTTVTTTSSINLDKGVKSQTIADFSEISATSATNNQQQYQPAKSSTNQPLSLAPGAAGLPSHLSGGVGYGLGGGDKIKDRPQVLFTRATPSPPVVDSKPGKPNTKTEYKKKFKPFSTYVYIPGSGWKKSKQTTKDPDAVGFSSETGRSTSEGALEWYGEVVERAKKACEFRSRSQFGHPVVGVDHLESIYKETNLWNQPKDRSIAALALATSNHLRVSTRSSKGNSRDSSRDSSKAASDRVTSNHANAIISPSKETQAIKKQFADKPKPAAKSAVASRSKSTSDNKGKSSTDKKRSGGLTTTTTGAKSTSVDSEGGKIWLKPKKEDKKASPPSSESVVTKGAENGESGAKDSLAGIDDKLSDGKGGGGDGETPATTGASSLVTSGSLTPMLSPREKEGGKDELETGTNAIRSPNTSDDQTRSPRPNSLVSSITTTNGGSGLSSPPGIISDGPVKTTEIKSPEEVTGVKSPSPELWRVAIDTGADINWTEAKPASGNLVDNKDLGDNDFSIESNANNLAKQLDETINKQPETQEKPENVNTSASANEDMYGPLSI